MIKRQDPTFYRQQGPLNFGLLRIVNNKLLFLLTFSGNLNACDSGGQTRDGASLRPPALGKPLY